MPNYALIPTNVLSALTYSSNPTSAQIQQVIDDAAALAINGAGAAVYFPAITYQRLDKPLRVSQSNIRLYGDGPKQTLLPFATGGGPMLFIGSEVPCPLVPSFTMRANRRNQSMPVAGNDAWSTPSWALT